MQVGSVERSYDHETGATKLVVSVDLVHLALALLALMVALVATSVKSTSDK